MNTYSTENKILVTGGDGQVASALKKAVIHTAENIVFCNREQADITTLASLQEVINLHRPDVIINTAAYTAVDLAETHIEESMLINHIGASNLANICQLNNIPLIHLSTDYVFDGNQTHAYKEDDTINPANTYGKSKWLGEEAIRQQCQQHVIIRVSGIFSEYRTNFLKTMVNLALQKKHLRIVNDQFTCPTYAGDIADMLIKIANDLCHTGTYHYCSNDQVSWHGFASEIIKQVESIVELIEPIPTTDYPTPAKRPAFSVLDCNKIKNDYAISQPCWKTGIRSALAALKN